MNIYNFISKIHFTILVLVIALFMISCSVTKPEPVVIVNTKYKLVEIPDRLLTKCSVSVPPPKDLYINSDYIEKEELLTNYILRLLTDLDTCNIKLLSIKNLQTKQKNIYSKKTKKVLK